MPRYNILMQDKKTGEQSVITHEAAYPEQALTETHHLGKALRIWLEGQRPVDETYHCTKQAGHLDAADADLEPFHRDELEQVVERAQSRPLLVMIKIIGWLVIVAGMLSPMLTLALLSRHGTHQFAINGIAVHENVKLLRVLASLLNAAVTVGIGVLILGFHSLLVSSWTTTRLQSQLLEKLSDRAST